jgi:RimJ/RimL family protein N-acetyltransferase
VRTVRLVPFTEAGLRLVQPWFEHPEVRHRLGGPEWPARELRLMREKPGGDFRGRTVLRVHSWLAVDQVGAVVAKVGGDVYDRWTRYDGEGPEGPLISSTVPGPAMGLAYVVEPARWGRGLGTATLRAVVASPHVADVRVFVAGIDADNVPSRRCAEAAGFRAEPPEPDWENTVHHVLRR